MLELEEAGWRKSEEKTVDKITNKDIKEVFLLVDKDKSGEVSRTVGRHGLRHDIMTFTFQEARLATKLLEKRFGIKNVSFVSSNNVDDCPGARLDEANRY